MPLRMLEPYDRNRPASDYQLTPKSFVVVARTFAMITIAKRTIKLQEVNVIEPARVAVSDETLSPSEKKVAATRSEQEPSSEETRLARSVNPATSQSEPGRHSSTILTANISPTDTEPTGKTDTSRPVT